MIIFQQALKLVKHIDNSISDFSILARLHRFNLIYFASNEKEEFTHMTIYISEKSTMKYKIYVIRRFFPKEKRLEFSNQLIGFKK